jgi:hypothetical protein
MALYTKSIQGFIKTEKKLAVKHNQESLEIDKKLKKNFDLFLSNDNHYH